MNQRSSIRITLFHFTFHFFFSDKKRLKTDEGDNTEFAQWKELKYIHI